MNLSSRTLSHTELIVLNRGMDFAFGAKKVNIPKVLASIEPAILNWIQLLCIHFVRIL